MSEDSGSDIDSRPSVSGSNGCRSRMEQKRKRRIVMRIEYDSSDDDSDSETEDDLDYRPSTSGSSERIQYNGRQLRNRLKAPVNRLNIEHSNSDGSSSGSEVINNRVNTRRKLSKNLVMSEEDQEDIERAEKKIDLQTDDIGFNSDSSSNELLEKCPICLLTFRKQEVGMPATCAHTFCANCIEAWSKNVQTCPIDRLVFDKIIVRPSYDNSSIAREINIDPKYCAKELFAPEDTPNHEDVTHCQACGRNDREDVLLLCDSCNEGCHIFCLQPPLAEVPEGRWYCSNCVDLRDEHAADLVALNEMLEDLRNMGIPEEYLHATEVQQPRIQRTLQHERIRAEILRIVHSTATDTVRTATRRSNRRTVSRTNDAEGTVEESSANTTKTRRKSRKSRKRRKRRSRQRTYVVEYDVNPFDEKFAIKTENTTIIRRRRRICSRRRQTSQAVQSDHRAVTDCTRAPTGRRRCLAEQLGIKTCSYIDRERSAGGLSLFGNANDFDYMSDSDQGGVDNDIQIDSGNGTAVQTSVRMSGFGSQRSRKALLMGKLQPQRRIRPIPVPSATAPSDILSNIFDMQDRWLNATRQLNRVHINTDGTLILKPSEQVVDRANINPPTPTDGATVEANTAPKNDTEPSQQQQQQAVTQAPMYPHGGNSNFNNSGGGDTGGGFNNRYNNQSNYRSGGNQYGRHSTGGINSGGGGGNFNNSMGGPGNFNFSGPNYNQNTGFSPFSIRFNPRNQLNQRNNNNQRNPMPFIGNMHNQARQNFNAQQSQLQQTQRNPEIDNLFAGLPPPIATSQTSQHETVPLFNRMPPPLMGNQSGNVQRIEPPPSASSGPMNIPSLMSIPPPPAPPPAVRLSWNNSLFPCNSNGGNDDEDDSNCPNFSVYSAESQEVAKSTEVNQSETDPPKEDDENEDLVQLDDDDEIPMPPERTGSTDLYEPENPTDEIDCKEQNERKVAEAQHVDNDEISENNTVTKSMGADDNNEECDPEPKIIPQMSEDSGKDDDAPKESGIDKPESTNDDSTSLNEPNGDFDGEGSGDINITECRKISRSPSLALSETKINESEASVANRKGVLELYDDSDWEELDIDRPKGYEQAVHTERGNDTETESEILPARDMHLEATTEAPVPDRSYTPCLDENNDPDENIDDIGGTPELVVLPSREKFTEEGKSKTTGGLIAATKIVEIDTELISDDDENNRGRNRRKDKNERRKSEERNNVEPFKKVSNKQKERNYRNDKQQQTGKRNDRHPSNSRSRTRSRSPRARVRPRMSRTGTYSKSKSRSRSRTRSKSPLRSPRGRDRRRSRSYGRRSKTRSYNKENQNWRQGQSRRDGANGRFLPRHRPKRRELPRYDVRNVIGVQRNIKDRYGRDTTRHMRSRSFSRGPRRARSISRSRSRSMSPKRARRCSFSISPSPPPAFNRHSISPRRYISPRRRSPSQERNARIRQRSRTPLPIRSRSISVGHRLSNRNVKRRVRGDSPMPRIQMSRSRSPIVSPRYTPRLSKSRSRSPFDNQKGKKKKLRDKRKKKSRKRAGSESTSPNRRLPSRPRDPYENKSVPKKKRHRSPKIQTPVQEPAWSPSPSPPPVLEYEHNNVVSWTPPIVPLHADGDFDPEARLSDSKSSKKEKRKRVKKKKKNEKRRDVRKEKRRQRRTETPEPAPSKEVFASGNNILVSVSFNKESANQQTQQQQTTVVTLPPTREDLITNRRTSIDALANSTVARKKKDRMHKRKKIEAKPIAIIDLERSPFQVHQEPADIIVLTDSDDGRTDLREDHRERLYSESGAEDVVHHHIPQQRLEHPIHNAGRAPSPHEKTPPAEPMNAILEESYDLPQTGPKTPPEPPVVKFNLPTKKQNKVRNPLHDEADEINDEMQPKEREDETAHRQELEPMHAPTNQKIGPNTPPESGPCSPDAYDPFEPTKSPSISPRSPIPPPLEATQTYIGDAEDLVPTQVISPDKPRTSGERIVAPLPAPASNLPAQPPTLNPVELVMALMNSKANTSQDMANKSNETQFTNTSSLLNSSAGVSSALDDSLPTCEKPEDTGITILSNVLLSTASSQSQHIPIISSPTPPVTKTAQITPLPLPKVGSSVSSSSGVGLPSLATNVRNGGGEELLNLNDIESPYSPGSADYEDLFEPPTESSTAKRRQKRGSGKSEVFDNLFGSSSPINQLRLPPYTPTSKKQKPVSGAPYSSSSSRKSKIKVGKSREEHMEVYDDLPNSAVELQVKDKLLRKLNRQERVVEEVKMVLKPRFNKKQITKEDYKEIMRRAVPKICHSRSGEINPHKIKNLIDAYVKKFRAKHKKLSIINTGQVSSAVKCAAYLKKL